MIDRKQGGSIVQISSVTTTKAFSATMIYAASKAAVDQMMKVMALEWGPHQVGIGPLCVGTCACVYVYSETCL